MQMTLEEAVTVPHLTPAERNVLNVLRDYRPHSALEFKRGEHGFFLDSVAQRVSALRRKGYRITSHGKGGHEVAVYRLERGLT